jgi:DNA (cytosine-5)-methyltransferase 1
MTKKQKWNYNFDNNIFKIATAFSGGFGSVEFALKYLNIAYEVVFACEWMKPQRESYIQNHENPTAEFAKDIKEFDGEKYKGQIDYYHLSPPCQEYSMSGNRGGANTDKGQLMFEAIKSIDEVQPKMFSVENVRGLLSSNNGEDWKNILKDFNTLKGYTISWGIMNAKEQGTPQNRERVFIVGFRSKCPKFSFPPRVPLKFKLFNLLEDDVDEKYFIKDISKYSKESQGNKIATKDVFQTINAGTHGYSMGYVDLIQTGNIDTKGHNSLWGRVYDTDGIAPTQNAKGGGAGAKTGLFKIKSNTKRGYEIAKNGDGINLSRPTSITRRGRVEKQVAQALDTSSSQGVLKNFKIRRLTPTECARVQGDFEDKFIMDGFSDTKLYEFIGNAMDINTTKNLITKMIEFSKNIEFGRPVLKTSFKKSINNTQNSLFGETA